MSVRVATRLPPGRPQWVVAMAASAGGLVALRSVLSALPAGFPAPIVIAQHLSPAQPSRLASLLGRHTALRVKQAEDDEPCGAGTVYVAPPDRHVRFTPDGRLAVSRGPRVHYQRPSADVLFASAAAHCAPQVVAVVLSGSGADGADGARAIYDAGGVVLAHAPTEAEFGGMPLATIDAGTEARVLPLDHIAAVLRQLVETESGAA